MADGKAFGAALLGALGAAAPAAPTSSINGASHCWIFLNFTSSSATANSSLRCGSVSLCTNSASSASVAADVAWRSRFFRCSTTRPTISVLALRLKPDASCRRRASASRRAR